MEPIKLTIAVNHYLDARRLALSPLTLRDYELTLRRLCTFLDLDPLLEVITPTEIREFLLTIPGGKKNKKNAYIALSAFWTWCIREEYACENIMRKVEPPKIEQRAVSPLTQQEVAGLLSKVRQRGRNQERDLAILLVLVDTGIRASELVGLKISDLEGIYLKVFGKGSRERRVPMSSATMAAILGYLSRRKGQSRKQPLFATEEGRHFSRYSLYQMLARLGQAADIENVYPHRFRHTFALNYLTNGGDPYTLQIILGHSTLDMVKRYLLLADRDVASAHRRASPVANWHL